MRVKMIHVPPSSPKNKEINRGLDARSQNCFNGSTAPFTCLNIFLLYRVGPENTAFQLWPYGPVYDLFDTISCEKINYYRESNVMHDHAIPPKT